MLRDALLFALYEEITTNYLTYKDAKNYIETLTYLTLDENACLLEMLVDWYKD